MRSMFCNSYQRSNVGGLDEDVRNYLGAFASLSQRVLPDLEIDEQLKQFMDFFRTNFPSNTTRYDVAFVTCIGTVMCGRKFFISADGLIGTAANEVINGDV